jgi:hypothetical protein
MTVKTLVVVSLCHIIHCLCVLAWLWKWRPRCRRNMERFGQSVLFPMQAPRTLCPVYTHPIRATTTAGKTLGSVPGF